jgi:Immunoglobulin domain
LFFSFFLLFFTFFTNFLLHAPFHTGIDFKSHLTQYKINKILAPTPPRNLHLDVALTIVYCCFNVSVVPPKVPHFEFSKELNVGDRTSVQCVAGTGDLPLVFTWLKDNVPIKQSGTVGANDNNNVDSRYNSDKNNNNNRQSNKDGVDDNNLIMIRQNDEFTSALSIISIKQSHAGEYTCRVQNDAATIEYSAMLKVNGTYITTP